MQDLKLIKTNKNEQCEKIFFRIVHFPTQGRWDDEDYRSITALPPTLSIDNNILSIEFKDALDNLTIHITDENSNIIYENTFSGAMGDIIDIPVNGMRTGTYQVILTHKLGWLVGEFENQ